MPDHPDGVGEDPRPRRPVEPAATDCCGEGCLNCVFDVYEAALERYDTEQAAWQQRQHQTHRG